MPSFLTTDFFSKFLLFSLVLVTSYLCYFCAWNSSLLSHPAIPKHRACSSALSNKTLVCLVTICLLKLTDCYWIPFSSFISLLGNPWISSDFLQIWVFIWSWSVLPFPSSGDLPDPGIEPRSPKCRRIPYHLSHQGGWGAVFLYQFAWSTVVYTALRGLPPGFPIWKGYFHVRKRKANLS